MRMTIITSNNEWCWSASVNCRNINTFKKRSYNFSHHISLMIAPFFCLSFKMHHSGTKSRTSWKGFKLRTVYNAVKKYFVPPLERLKITLTHKIVTITSHFFFFALSSTHFFVRMTLSLTTRFFVLIFLEAVKLMTWGEKLKMKMCSYMHLYEVDVKSK